MSARIVPSFAKTVQKKYDKNKESFPGPEIPRRLPVDIDVLSLEILHSPSKYQLPEGQTQLWLLFIQNPDALSCCLHSVCFITDLDFPSTFSLPKRLLEFHQKCVWCSGLSCYVLLPWTACSANLQSYADMHSVKIMGCKPSTDFL